MALTSVSRSAFSRKGTSLNMKPGVKTLSVGTIDVLGITLDRNNSIDISNEKLRLTNPSGTKTFTYDEDLFHGGLIKEELMPNIALTQVYVKNDYNGLNPEIVQIGDVAVLSDTGLMYISKNSNNSSISDWQSVALGYSHPAKDVTNTTITNWNIGYNHSQIESNNEIDSFWNNVLSLMNVNTIGTPASVQNSKSGGATISLKSTGGIPPETKNLSDDSITSLIGQEVAYYMGNDSNPSTYGFSIPLGSDIGTTGFVIEFWHYSLKDESTGISFLTDFRTSNDDGWQILIKGSNDSVKGDFYINVDNAGSGEVDTNYDYKHDTWHYLTIQYIPISAEGSGKLEIWDYEQDRGDTQLVCQQTIGVPWTDNQTNRTLHLFDSWNSSGNTSTPLGYFQDIRVTLTDRGYDSVFIPEVPTKPFGASLTPVDPKNPHSLNAIDVGAISIKGENLLKGDLKPKYNSYFNLGSSSKRFSKLYVDSIYMGANQNTISNNYDWDEIASFIKGTGGFSESDGFDVYLKGEIDDFLPGAGSDNPYMELISTTGGTLMMGDESPAIVDEDIIATISFVTKDVNVIQTDIQLQNYQLENVHAQMIARITDEIDNLDINGNPNAGGTWQRDANIEFLTGKNELSSTFRILSDNTISIPLKSWRDSSGVWDATIKPTVEDQVIKIFANSADKSIYYNLGTANDANTHEFIKLLYGYDVLDSNDNYLYEGSTSGQSTNFNVIGAEEVNAKTLKINNKVVDLDNIITSYESWSENKVELEITTTAGDITDIGNVVLEQVTSNTLMPADATLLKLVILVRWRLTSNTHTIESNGLESGMIQAKESTEGSYKTLKDYSGLSGSYYTPKETSSSGDMIFLESTYDTAELTAFKTSLEAGDLTFNLIFKDVKSLQDNLILRDFSWGIRKYWR